MAEVVTDVGEIGRFGLEALDNGEGLVDGGVGGVRFVAEGVEKEDIEIAELVHRLFGDLIVIGEVGYLADTVAEHDHGAMVERDGGNLLAEELEGFAVEDVDGEAGNGVFLAAVGEHVFEDAADDDQGRFRSVDGDGAALAIVEGTEIIEAEDMVGVGVRIKDGVEVGDTRAKALGAEVRGGVDDDVFAREIQPDGGAHAVIARVVGGADIAVATNRRNADAGAGAEDSEGDVGVI